MNNKLKASLLVVAIVTVIGLAFLGYNSLSKYYKAPATTEKPSPTIEKNNDYLEDAPDVTIYNSKGEEVSLASLLGKPTVINFWASWCGPCKAELPDFQSVFDEKSKDVNFIMVNLTDGFRETQSRAEKLISSSGYTFPIFFDNDGNASDEYGVYSIPTTFFVNANGEIENIHTGLITKEQLIKEIEDMM